MYVFKHLGLFFQFILLTLLQILITYRKDPRNYIFRSVKANDIQVLLDRFMSFGRLAVTIEEFFVLFANGKKKDIRYNSNRH